MTMKSAHRALFAAALAALLAAVALLAPGAGAHVAGTGSGSPSINGLIAPGPVCPGQNNFSGTYGEQERTMRCLTDFARSASGLPPLKGNVLLDRAANRKDADLLKCNEFSHEPCGRPFTYWMMKTGYLTGSCWQAGENIAFGSNGLGGPRKVFVAWMKSPGHRENILGEYEDIGIGLRFGSLEGTPRAHVWTQEFGKIAC